MPHVVNRSEIADILGVSKPTIDNWIAKGLPVLKSGKRGKASEFDAGACHQWKLEQEQKLNQDHSGETHEEARTRKTVTEANLLDIELKRKRGEVVEIEDVVRVMRNHFISIRSGLLNLGKRLPPELLVMDNERDIKELLNTEIEETLTGLANAITEAEQTDKQGQTVFNTASEANGQ